MLLKVIITLLALLAPWATQAQIYIKSGEVGPSNTTLPSTTGDVYYWNGDGIADPYYGTVFTTPSPTVVTLLQFTFYIREHIIGTALTYQPFIYEFDTTALGPVGSPVYTGSQALMPPVGAIGGTFEALTTTFLGGVTLEPTKTYVFTLQGIGGSGTTAYAYASLGPGTFTRGKSLVSQWQYYPGLGPAFWASFLEPPTPPPTQTPTSPPTQTPPACDATGVTIKAKASRKSAWAGKASTLKYRVTAAYANKTKGAAFEKAGVTVTLPAGVTVAKTAVTPRVKLAGGATYPAAVVSGNTVVFADAPLAGRKRRTYTVWLKIATGTASPLVVSSKLTNCNLAASNVTVTVK